VWDASVVCTLYNGGTIDSLNSWDGRLYGGVILKEPLNLAFGRLGEDLRFSSHCCSTVPPCVRFKPFDFIYVLQLSSPCRTRYFSPRNVGSNLGFINNLLIGLHSWLLRYISKHVRCFFVNSICHSILYILYVYVMLCVQKVHWVQ